MQTITAKLDAAFRAAIIAAFGFEADPSISPSTTDKFGDYQSNAAMGLSKEIAARNGQKTNPRAVAEAVVAKLQLGEMASEISIAGPGFINVRLAPAWIAARVGEASAQSKLGFEPATVRQIVVVDYSGPNVAKEMHVGHLRSTIIGDAISRTVEFMGHAVIRQNHIGDWGTQFGMLIAYGEKAGIFSAAYMAKISTYGDPSKPFDESSAQIAGQNKGIRDLEEFYRAAKIEFDSNQEFQAIARKRVVDLQSGERIANTLWKIIVEETRRSYQPIYERLNVMLVPSDERGESFYNPFLGEVVAGLKAKGLAVLSDGATVVPTEGFENPLIIEKTGGGYLYATTDLAAVRYRVFELRANRIIYTHDSRQAQHFAQVFQTAYKAGFAPNVSLEYAPFGTMLGEDGKPFKTRSGGTVKLKDLLDEAERRGYELAKSKDAERLAKAQERGDSDLQPIPDSELQRIGRQIGIGAVKYSDLSKDRTSDYVFSWDKALAMDGNTGPYLQYAHARIKSIFRKAGEISGVNAGEIRFESVYELALAKHLLRFGEVVEAVGRELRPHLMCTYLYEVATRFSSFYENCPVLQSQEPTRGSRLALCRLAAQTLATGLDLLGIEHPEQM